MEGGGAGVEGVKLEWKGVELGYSKIRKKPKGSNTFTIQPPLLVKEGVEL